MYKTIAGFANGEGGKLVIGVEDVKNKPLKITGLKHDFEYVDYSKLKSLSFEKSK